MVTRISPALAAANWVSVHSGRFSDQMPIRSPRSQAEREKARGQRVDAFGKFLPGPAHIMAGRDQRLAIAPALDGLVEARPMVSPSSGASEMPET